MMIEQYKNVVTLRDDTVKAGWETWVCLMSDVHFDAAKCDLPLVNKHLTLANEREALVLIAGDWFDAMQSKHDPRRSPEDLKAEYAVSSYLDALVKYAADYLGRFNRCKFILALGNHETAVLKNNNTNLMDRLADKLRDKYKIDAVNAGYAGWVRWLFSRGKGARQSFSLYYHHSGGGGNAPVSKGIIQSNRQAAAIRADFVHNGHNHQNYHHAEPQVYLSPSGRQVKSLTHFIRTPGYKIGGLEAYDEFGYDIERHPHPLTRGCAFIQFTADDVIRASVETKLE